MTVFSSADDGATWTTGKQLGPTPASQGAYAQMVEIASGTVAVLYSIEDDHASSATLRLGYLGDGYAFSPLGDDFASPGLSVTGCRLRHVTGAPTIPDNALTALPFTTEEVDTHAFHSISTNTSRVTIPAGMGGYYRLIGNVMFSPNATGRRQARIVKNATLGGSQAAVADVPTNAAGETTVGFSADLVLLAAGDYVEVYAYQNSGGALGIKYEATTFTVIRVGS